MSPHKHRRHGQKVVDAAAGGEGWISMADLKRGVVRVLWYQDMSRVCPGCPQTAPREAREVSCIRDAYDKLPVTKVECRMQNAECRMAGQSRPKSPRCEGRMRSAE
jgi:hypothetical protein